MNINGHLIGHLKVKPEAIEHTPGTNSYRVRIRTKSISDIFFGGKAVPIMPMQSKFMLTIDGAEPESRVITIIAVNEYQVDSVEDNVVELTLTYIIDDDSDAVVVVPTPTKFYAYKSALAINFACGYTVDSNTNIAEYMKSKFDDIVHLGTRYHLVDMRIVKRTVEVNIDSVITNVTLVESVWMMYSSAVPANKSDVSTMFEIVIKQLKDTHSR